MLALALLLVVVSGSLWSDIASLAQFNSVVVTFD